MCHPSLVRDVDVGEQVGRASDPAPPWPRSRPPRSARDGAVDRVELGRARAAPRRSRGAERVQAVASRRRSSTSFGAAVGLLVALEVPVVAVRPCIRSASGRRPRGRARSPRRRPRGPRRSRGRRRPRPACRSPSARLAMSTPDLVERARGGLGVAVVLDHEDRRQFPDAREVQRLEERALVGAAVAEEGRRRPGRCRLTLAVRPRRSQRRAATDDAVGARACPGRRRRCASSRPCPGRPRSPCRRSRPSCP